MGSVENTISELINSFHRQELVVFCGAGISYNSGLPVVGQLVPCILDKLGMTPQDKDLLLDAGGNLRNFPFESFIEVLRGNSFLDPIFDIYDADKPNLNTVKPNTNHILLAKLVKRNLLSTIVTTNFDQLIEKSLESEGLVVGKDFDVLYKESDFEKIDWTLQRVRVIKIHGSVHDKVNMAITMQQVAARKLSEFRKSVIDHIFATGNHKSVFVLGYSCSDSFDISPHIENIRAGQKQVYLLEHFNEPKVEDIRAKQEKNPFHRFEGGWRLYYNTDDLIKKFWSECVPEEVVLSRKSITLWRSNVDRWFDNDEARSKASKYQILGAVLTNVSEFHPAIVYYEKALEVARGNNERKLEGIILSNIAGVYHGVGELHRMTHYLEDALVIARELGNKEDEQTYLVGIGTNYHSLGDYRKAFECHGQALKISLEIGDKRYEGIALGNIGLDFFALSEYQEAIECFNQSLKLAQGTGNKRNESQRLGDLGMVYCALAEYKKAETYYAQALKLTREIGDKYGESQRLGNLGTVYRYLKQHRQALECHSRALEIANHIDDKRGIGNHLVNIASVCLDLHQYRQALGANEQAVNISREVGDKRNVGVALGGLGNAYIGLEEYPKGRECFVQAIKIFEEIGDKRDAGNSWNNLGAAYFHLNKTQQALDAFRQSYTVLKSLLSDDHPTIKSLEKNIGIAESMMIQAINSKGA